MNTQFLTVFNKLLDIIPINYKFLILLKFIYSNPKWFINFKNPISESKSDFFATFFYKSLNHLGTLYYKS